MRHAPLPAVLAAVPLLILAMLLAGPGPAGAAAIRCHPARGAVAATICDSPEYLAMDREIAALFDRATAQVSPGDRSLLVKSQAHFLDQREGCGWAAHHSAHPGSAIDECVRASMEGRVRSLRTLVDRAGRFEAAR